MWPKREVICLAVLLSLCAANGAKASDGGSEGEPAHHNLVVGLRGFGGIAVADAEVTGAGGLGAAFAVLLPRHFELELGLSAIRPREEPWLGSVELIARRVFERERGLSPHINLGPLLSLELESGETSVSGGLLAGGGISHWLSSRWGLVADANYRLLLAERTRHVLSCSVGLSLRI